LSENVRNLGVGAFNQPFGNVSTVMMPQARSTSVVGENGGEEAHIKPPNKGSNIRERKERNEMLPGVKHLQTSEIAYIYKKPRASWDAGQVPIAVVYGLMYLTRRPPTDERK
jgi:hypothetical protein